MKEIKIGFLRGIGFILASLIPTIIISICANIHIQTNNSQNILSKIINSEEFPQIIFIILICLFVFFIYKARQINKSSK